MLNNTAHFIPNIDLSYLRPAKRQSVQEMFENCRFRSELSALSYEDALVLPGKNRKGGVVDKDGSFVEASKSQWFGGAYDLEDSKEIVYDARKVVFLGEYATSCWGHGFVSLLVRFWYSSLSSDDIDAYVIIAETPEQTPNNKALNDLIRLAGIEEKVIYVNRPTRFKEVIVPEPSFTAHSYTNQFWETIDIIKENALKESDNTTSTPEKIFLSRRHFNKAIQGEGGLELLDDFFENNGFTIIYPEEHSLSQMIRIMHNATICASESGSITFNTLFGASNLQVVVIERTALFTFGNLMTNLSRAKQITYIDGHYTIYPSNVGGPCILGFTDEFERFANDNSYQHPSPIYLESDYKKECFEKFEKRYLKMNTYSRFLGTGKKDARPDLRPVVCEAFSASIDQFPWLDKEAIIEKYYKNSDFLAL